MDTTTSYKKKEPGDVDSLSGNFLNFIVSSRIDAVLKSLIGGKADCPAGKNYCILKPQGASHTIKDGNLKAKCYVRPQSGYNDV